MSLQKFISLIKTEALSRASRFEVIIMPPRGISIAAVDLERLSLLATSASLPGLNIEVRDLKIYGPVYPRPVTMDFGGTLSITFLQDRYLQTRDFFQQWLFTVVDPNSFNVSYQQNYISDGITVTQLDQADGKTYTYKFLEAFPISLSKSELDYTNTEFIKFTVEFRYRKWIAIPNNQG